MNPDDWVVLARIRKSRGRIGELLADSFLGSADEYAKVGEVTLAGGMADGETYRIERAWMHQGRLVLKFCGVDTISEAERLAGCEVRIRREHRPPPGEGEVYLMDLVGCTLESPGGERIGVIEGWESDGERKYLDVAAPGGHSFLVPFHRDLLRRFDLDNRRVVAVLPDGLADLNRA